MYFRSELNHKWMGLNFVCLYLHIIISIKSAYIFCMVKTQVQIIKSIQHNINSYFCQFTDFHRQQILQSPKKFNLLKTLLLLKDQFVYIQINYLGYYGNIDPIIYSCISKQQNNDVCFGDGSDTCISCFRIKLCIRTKTAPLIQLGFASTEYK